MLNRLNLSLEKPQVNTLAPEVVFSKKPRLVQYRFDLTRPGLLGSGHLRPSLSSLGYV